MSVRYSVKVSLAMFSGNRCAMPSCRRPLAERNGQEVVFLGQAAHIAGEHGGTDSGRAAARYDPTMTSEQRNSLANLIYVCPTCHSKIDSYPTGERDYTVQHLLDIKQDHESAAKEAMDAAMTSVSFVELETATRWVTNLPPQPGQDFVRIPLGDKIRKNDLSTASQNLIRSHLTVTPQVREFIQRISLEDSDFPERLKAGFLKHYYQLRANGILNGEHLFNSMCLFSTCGFIDATTQFAAQSVLIYLFETCEVFEK